MNAPPDLSLVVPVYNERDNLAPLVTEIAAALGGIGVRYELVAVDDGSRDGSLEVLKALKRDHPEVHIVRFCGVMCHAKRLRQRFGRVRVWSNLHSHSCAPRPVSSLHPRKTRKSRQRIASRSPA